MKNNCYSIIIAGGKGTRFWPLSRAQRPKQLLKILSRKSLIDETVARVLAFGGRAQTLVVTVTDQLAALKKELRRLPRGNFIAEPEGKNTAPCIGLAALEIIHRDPEGIMVVLPADHWVTDTDAFRRTLSVAVDLAARQESLITIGICPDYPETGYGYIIKGKRVGGRTHSIFEVRNFTEKPNLARAKKLLRQGSLWNSGIFVWRAAVLANLLNRYRPEIGAALTAIKNAANGKSLSSPNRKLRAVLAREYRKLPNISVDYAVLERAGMEGKVITVQADFGWSDVGSWAAVHRMIPKDAHGNGGIGRWLQLGAKNCLIHSPHRLIVLLGVENALVVDTPDALLVGDLDRSQQVRELVEELHRKGLGAYTIK